MPPAARAPAFTPGSLSTREHVNAPDGLTKTKAQTIEA